MNLKGEILKFMPNIFKGMNRKQKREFDKLDSDKKSEILQAAIVDKVSGTMATEIAKAMISGMELEREQLYNNYVSKIQEIYDSRDGDIRYAKKSIDEIGRLLSYLRVEHLKYIQKQKKNIQDGEKNEDFPLD